MQPSIRYPKRQDSQKTFQHIVETSKKLFAKQGFHATSINEIIEKSKIATGTFYLYFKDKLALYHYILDQYRHQIRNEIATSIQPSMTRYEKEFHGLRAFLNYAWKDRLAYQIIWESMLIDYDIFKTYYVSFSQDYIKQLSRSKDEIYDDLDLETLSFMLMGIANFVGLQILFKDTFTQLDLDRITNQVMNVLKHGMFKEKK